MSPERRGRDSGRVPRSSRTVKRSGATRVTPRKPKPARSGATAIGDVTTAIGRRKRARMLRRVLFATILALLLALIAGAVWVVGFSRILALTTVEVTGQQTVTADQVRAAADAPLGTPLARVEPQPIASRVTQLVQVQSVTVEKHYPHTLRIVVHERTPAFILETNDGRRLIDAQGVDYLAAPDPAPAGLVTAKLPTGGSGKLYADLATVAQGLPADLKTGILTASTRDSITLTLPDNRVVFWGSAEQTPLKAQVATALLKSTKASVYDVSSPSHPVTR